MLPGYVAHARGRRLDVPRGEPRRRAPDQVWVGIGYITADLRALLLLVALILGGIGLRRSGSGKGDRLLKTSTVIATVLLAAYVVAVWAMGAKPN